MEVPFRALKLAGGKWARVSAYDFPRVARLKWCDRGDGYARARWPQSLGGNGKVIYLHRFVLLAPPGFEVDHIDNDPLNNTRRNLQISTKSRNQMRSLSRRGGVSRLHNSDRWRARLRIDGELFSLGCFDTKEAAAAAVDEARRAAWENKALNPLGLRLGWPTD